MNYIALHGKLTADPELKTIDSGVECCSFTVAINRPTGKDKEKITDFIPCTAWRQTAAFLSKYFHKGDGIIVEGALQSRKYTDKEGNNRTAYDVNVNHIEFCEKKGDVGNATMSGFTEASDEPLPF